MVRWLNKLTKSRWTKWTNHLAVTCPAMSSGPFSSQEGFLDVRHLPKAKDHIFGLKLGGIFVFLWYAVTGWECFTRSVFTGFLWSFFLQSACSVCCSWDCRDRSATSECFSPRCLYHKITVFGTIRWIDLFAHIQLSCDHVAGLQWDRSRIFSRPVQPDPTRTWPTASHPLSMQLLWRYGKLCCLLGTMRWDL